MSFRTMATVWALFLVLTGCAWKVEARVQAKTYKKVIPVTAQLNCPDGCKGTCVFQDTFVVELKDDGGKLIVTSIEDYFSRTTIKVDKEAKTQCGTERDFGKIVAISFTGTDGTEVKCESTAPDALKKCGLEIIRGEGAKRPAGLRRPGEVVAFKFSYVFKATCGCDGKGEPVEVTVDLEFKDGKFFVGGEEFK